MTAEVGALYTVPFIHANIAILAAPPEAQLDQSVVLLAEDPTQYNSYFKHEEDAKYLQKLVGNLALERESTPPARITARRVRVPVQQTHSIIFEHLAVTGQLLSPTAAMEIAGAAQMAYSQLKEKRIFPAQAEYLVVSPLQLDWTRARARRRQTERKYSRRSLTPWK